jgi:hypothetical protein
VNDLRDMSDAELREMVKREAEIVREMVVGEQSSFAGMTFRKNLGL